MRVPVAARQLNQAQPVAMRVEPHGLGIDRNRRAEGHPLGKIAVMQLMTHADCARRSCGHQPLPSAGSFSSPMAGILARPPCRCNRDRRPSPIRGVRRAAIHASIGAVSRGDTHAGGASRGRNFAMSDRASPQSSPRIEQLAPELEKIISPSEPIQHLAEGFGGPQGPAEGPLWWKEGGFLVFSDIHNNKRMKYEPGKGVSLLLEPTNRANGLTRDLQGRLLACEHDSRRVTRLELDGSLTVIANSFQGRQLNRPNDVVVKSDGCIYFTDPWTSPNPPQQWDLTFSGVYRVTPDLGTMTLLTDDFVLPNGLAFSPDETVLYINDSRH